MQLDEFFKYKWRLMKDLLTDEKILRLLTDDGSLPEDPKALLYNQVFPYHYLPETVEHGHTYICCEVEVQKSLNSTFLLPDIYIWVSCHKSLLRLPDGGGVRTDKLAAAIAERINGSRQYGLGELDLFSVRRYVSVADYQGRVMLFQAKDFNRQPNGGKNAPSHRGRLD